MTTTNRSSSTWQRDVNTFAHQCGIERSRFELLATRIQVVLKTLFGTVDFLTRCRTLIYRQLTDRLCTRGQFALLAKISDPHCIKRSHVARSVYFRRCCFD
jgi:hypothetical protein